MKQPNQKFFFFLKLICFCEKINFIFDFKLMIKSLAILQKKKTVKMLSYFSNKFNKNFLKQKKRI